MKAVSIVIKGAGEMASGIAHRLFMANITRICMTEIERPLAVRRGVSFCEVVFTGEMEVEGVIGKLVRDGADLAGIWRISGSRNHRPRRVGQYPLFLS